MNDYYKKNSKSASVLSEFLKKTRTITGFLLLFTLAANAQLTVSNYTFSESTEVYAQITGTTSTATGDDGRQSDIPIGFTFNFGDVNYTTLSISTNGFVRLGTTITSTAHVNSLGASSTFRPLIAAFWDDNNLSTGTIRYAVTGAAPNRVFTVNWHNFKAGGGGSTSGPSVSTLLRLYETTNVIEMVYGTPFTTTNTVSASVGLNDQTTFLSVTPGSTSTTSGTTANNNIDATAMGTLAGKKLTFTPPAPITPPSCIALPTSPANNAVGVVSKTFTWPSAVGGATGYKISVGTNTEADNLLDGFDVGLVNTYNYTDLALTASTQYFWKLTPYNLNGESQGCVTWSFTSGNAPNCITNFVPVQGATDVAKNPTLSWTNPTNPSATSFDVYFGTSSEPLFLGNFATAAAASAGLPTPLMSNTQYFIKVVSKNALGEATGCETSSFTTGTSLLYCPTSYTSGCNTDAIVNVVIGSYSNPTGCVTGAGTFFNNTGIQFEQGLNANIAVTFGLDGTQWSAIWIDFNQDGVFSDSEGVLAPSNPGASGTTTYNIPIPLTALTGVTRMRIRGGNDSALNLTQSCGVSSSGYGETEDYEITILPSATCAMPTNVTSSNVTTTSVSLAWNIVPAAEYYEIEYGLSGFTLGEGTLIDDADVSPYELNGLTPDSNYQFYIRSVCASNDVSNTAGPFSFTTLPTCFPVMGVVAAAQGYTEAVISWDAVDGATNYNIQYGPTGFELGEGTILSGIIASPFTLTSLTNGTSYDIYVQSNCDADGTSQWSSVATITAGPCIPVYQFGKTDGDLISNISIIGTTLSNNTGAEPVNPSYTFFTGQPNFTAELRQGTTYSVSVTVGAFAGQNLAAWIDFNQNAVFETSERIGFTTASIGSNGTATFQIQLPIDAPLGTFRLRVRDVWAISGIDINPCSSYGYGETEDYNITVIEPITTVINPDFCGTTLSIPQFAGQFLGAVTIPNAQEYEFRIQNGTFTSTTVSSDGQLSFSNFNGHQFNTTYDVSVRVKVADAYGPYGATCQITTPVAPIIPIEASHCNTTILNTQYERIYAEEFTHATQWIFKIDNGTVSHEVTRNVDYAHFYDFVPNIAYGTTYQVSVSAKVGGIWTGFGPSCPISITAEPKTDILYNTCGTTLTNIASNITLKPVDLANMYRITIKNMATNVEVSMDQTSRVFRISNFSNAAYGTIFEVKAQVSIDGGLTFFAANTPCSIGTPSLPIAPPNLSSAFCGITIPRLNADIYTPWVNDNAVYCFNISVNGTFVEEVEMPTRRFRLTDLTVAPQMGVTYTLKVRIKLFGSYTDYGTSCDIFTPSVPLAQLSNASCNSNIAGFGTTLRAGWVNSQVNAFKFAIVDENMNILSEVERSTEDVNLTLFPGITPQSGTTYLIRVKVRIGSSWGEYGNTCSVTTPGGSQTVTRNIDEVSVFEVNAFPNPFSESLTIAVESSSDSSVEINVYDMTGKLVSNLKQASDIGSISIGNQLASGVYHVQIIQDNNIKTLKVVKK